MNYIVKIKSVQQLNCHGSGNATAMAAGAGAGAGMDAGDANLSTNTNDDGSGGNDKGNDKMKEESLKEDKTVKVEPTTIADEKVIYHSPPSSLPEYFPTDKPSPYIYTPSYR